MVIKKCDILENINIEHQKYIYSTTTVSNTTFNICLLYTSDAADDMQCVDLGGRRIIKKT